MQRPKYPGGLKAAYRDCQSFEGNMKVIWSPSDDSISFAHISQIFHQLPHARIGDLDLINIHCK